MNAQRTLYLTLWNALHSKKWVFGTLCILCLLPLWCFPYIPTQDGPSHLYNAYVLGNYSDPLFSQYYRVNWSPFPNWTVYLLLVPLLKIFPYLIAEKLLFSLYVVAFLWSVGYFIQAFQPKAPPLNIYFPGACFVYNFFFFMGFYNFVLSVPLFLGMVGYWWKHRSHLTLRRLLWLYALIGVTYFTHLFSYVLFFCTVAILGVLTSRFQGRFLLRTFFALLPGCSLIFFYLPNSDVLQSSKRGLKFPQISLYLPSFQKSLDTARHSLYNMMVSLQQEQSKLLYWLIPLLVILAIYTLGRKTFASLRKPEQRFWEAKDALIPLFFFFFALYLYLPHTIGTGGWVNVRMALFLWPIAFAWLTVPRRPWLQWLYVGVTLPGLLVVLVLITQSFARTNETLQTFTAPLQYIKKNSVILPASYSKFEESHRIGIMFHAHSYYSIARHSVSLGNYEAVLDYFPINFRPALHQEFRRSCYNLKIYRSVVNILENKLDHFDLCRLAHTVDYVLLWKRHGMYQRTRQALQRCYTSVYAKNDVFLYKSRRTRKFPTSSKR